MSATITSTGRSVDLIVVYRPPGHQYPFANFVDELTPLLEDSTLKCTPLVITGDLNIHFDNVSAPNTKRFNDLLVGYGLSNFFSDLDVVPGISDHSAIVGQLHLEKPRPVCRTKVLRNIKAIDRLSFAADVQQSNIIASCSDGIANLIDCYNSTLKTLLDVHAPAKSRPVKFRPHAPCCSISLARLFGEFFTNKIDAICTSLSPDISQRPSRTITVFDSFEPTSTEEIESLIRHTPAKSCDLDPIPTMLLKDCSHIFAPIVAEIVNLSMNNGIVPAALKLAHVHPTLKKSSLNPELLKNYRPISNLPYISKVLERVVFSRLSDYLRENNLLDSRQSAYRARVETLLVNLSNDILMEMDLGRITVLVSLDLSSAFDTVHHDILLNILSSLGIQDVVLDWFKSYLTNRQQVIIKSLVCNDCKTLQLGWSLCPPGEPISLRF
ncbi:uncharacterized protein [Asterias amurensis]|uniref:uncharacterized protein n=1 Tax=Asterias amurensis TaxID=7602 RepID=UPI003AB6262F